MTKRRSVRLVYNITAAVALALVSAACANTYQSGARKPDVPIAEQQDQHAGLLLRYCRKMKDAKDLYVAASMCRRAFDIDPTDTTPLYTLADIYGEMGAIESKAEAYRLALRVNPDEEEALYGLAKTSIDLGHYDVAVAQLERAIQLNSDDPRYYNAMGIAKDQMGEHETAQSLYRAGLAIDSGNVPLRNNLGLSLSLSGNHEESVAMLRDVASDPSAGAVGSRNLAHAATSAAQFDAELADAKTEPMEIIKPAEPEFDNASMAVPEHMAFMDVLDQAVAQAEGQPADGTMMAAMSKPITALEGGEVAAMEMAETEHPRSIGSADGTTGQPGSEPEVAARMPADAFSGQAKPAEGSDAVPSPEKIMSNLEQAERSAAPKQMAAMPKTNGEVSYTVQIGSFMSMKGAEKGWTILSGAAGDLLADRPHRIVEVNFGGETGNRYRLRTGDAAGKGSADKLCAELSDQNIECYVVRLPEAPIVPADSMAKTDTDQSASGTVEQDQMTQPTEESTSAESTSTEG